MSIFSLPLHFCLFVFYYKQRPFVDFKTYMAILKKVYFSHVSVLNCLRFEYFFSWVRDDGLCSQSFDLQS